MTCQEVEHTLLVSDFWTENRTREKSKTWKKIEKLQTLYRIISDFLILPQYLEKYYRVIKCINMSIIIKYYRITGNGK